MKFLEDRMFKDKLLRQNTDGEWLEKPMTIAEKMEKLLEIASERRQMTLQRICDSVKRLVLDDKEEISEKDMTQMFQCRRSKL